MQAACLQSAASSDSVNTSLSNMMIEVEKMKIEDLKEIQTGKQMDNPKRTLRKIYQCIVDAVNDAVEDHEDNWRWKKGESL